MHATIDIAVDQNIYKLSIVIHHFDQNVAVAGKPETDIGFVLHWIWVILIKRNAVCPVIVYSICLIVKGLIHKVPVRFTLTIIIPL